MKKYLLYLFVILIPLNYSYADKLLKSGFLSGEWDLDTNFNLDNPNDKIIIIFAIENYSQYAYCNCNSFAILVDR